MRRICAGLLALSLLPAGAAAEPQPRVATDARMDLMGLVQLLSGAPRVPRNPFTDAAAVRFSRFRSHPAVLALAAMRARGGGDGYAAEYAVYLSSPPELSENPPAPVLFADAFGGRAALEAWRRDLSAFARDSGFLTWEEETRGEREAFADAARRAQGGRDLAAPLVRMLGARTWGDWIVYVSPFFPQGNSDAWILEEKVGRPQVAVFFGPYWEEGHFSGGHPEEFAADAWPEAVFTMTYALSEACRPAYRPARDICRGLDGLLNAEDCVQHYWVREVVGRLLEENFGRPAASAYRARSKSGPRDDEARTSIEAYLHDRVRYRDLVDAAAPLYAPFGVLEAPCRTDDPGRFDHPIYARRMSYYLEARLEAGPDEKAAAALRKLRERGGRAPL
jgi:hypothetical protein